MAGMILLGVPILGGVVGGTALQASMRATTLDVYGRAAVELGLMAAGAVGAAMYPPGAANTCKNWHRRPRGNQTFRAESARWSAAAEQSRRRCRMITPTPRSNRTDAAERSRRRRGAVASTPRRDPSSSQVLVHGLRRRRRQRRRRDDRRHHY